jgi:hypothetical protein
MSRNGWPTDRECRRDLIDRKVAFSQQIEDLASSSISECLEGITSKRLGRHEIS